MVLPAIGFIGALGRGAPPPTPGGKKPEPIGCEPDATGCKVSRPKRSVFEFDYIFRNRLLNNQSNDGQQVVFIIPSGPAKLTMARRMTSRANRRDHQKRILLQQELELVARAMSRQVQLSKQEKRLKQPRLPTKKY